MENLSLLLHFFFIENHIFLRHTLYDHYIGFILLHLFLSFFKTMHLHKIVLIKHFKIHHYILETTFWKPSYVWLFIQIAIRL
jgi:hypothetical protein